MSKQKDATDNKKVSAGKLKVHHSKLKVSKANKRVYPGNEKVTLPGRKGVHIGYTLGLLLKKLGLSTTDLANLLGISRQSTHRMLRKKYLHAATLVKISEALNHDVVRYLYRPEHLPGNKKLKERVEELERENGALKEKVEMLEELNALLRKR